MSGSKIARICIESIKCVGIDHGGLFNGMYAQFYGGVNMNLNLVSVWLAAMDLTDVEYLEPAVSAANAYIVKGNKEEVFPVEEADEKFPQGVKDVAKAEAPVEEEAGADCSASHDDDLKPGEENPRGY